MSTTTSRGRAARADGSAAAGVLGPVLILVSALSFGAMAIFAKLAYAAGVSTETLLLLRFSVAASILWLALAVRPDLRRRPAVPPASVRRPISRRAALVVALALGAVGYATQATLYYSALTRIDASLVALMLYTYPPLVVLAAAALGRERLTARRCVAVMVASVGTLLVLLGAGGVGFDLVGVALAFGSAVMYTAYILVADTVVDRLPPVVLATLVMTGAAVSLGLRGLLSGGFDLRISASGWVWVLCIAVVSTVVAMLTYFAGLARTGPSAASILSTFEPVVTTALAALTLHEFLTPAQLLGALLVLASVAVLQLRTRREGAALGQRVAQNDRSSMS